MIDIEIKKDLLVRQLEMIKNDLLDIMIQKTDDNLEIMAKLNVAISSFLARVKR